MRFCTLSTGNIRINFFQIDIVRCGVSANEATLHPNNNFKKVNHYRSMYALQHGALAHTQQQAIKGPKITSVNPTGETGINYINKRQLLYVRLECLFKFKHPAHII